MKSRRTSLVTAVALLTALGSSPAAGQVPETIVVNNALDRPVLVWLDGMPTEVVPATEEKTIGPVPEGPVTLMATDVANGSVIATEHTSLAEGETFRWTLYLVPVFGEEAGVGTVVLVNGLDRVIEVTLGGRTTAVLAPGATRVLPRVVAGTVDAVALTSDGTTLASRTLTIADGQVTSWRIGA